MNTPELKPLLRQTLVAARARESAFTDLCDDAPPDPSGRWTPKDHLAHLAAWREHATTVLVAAARGETYDETLDIDEQNARTYAGNRDVPAAVVKATAARTYDELTAALEACTEDDLRRPRTGRPWEIWRVVPGNGHPHLGQHLCQWYLEVGDVAAAESAALWVRELDDLFTDPPSRAAAAYNLACFYARTGRAEQAVPLLQESFDLDTSLREWAAHDADLDPIRQVQGVSELIGSVS